MYIRQSGAIARGATTKGRAGRLPGIGRFCDNRTRKRSSVPEYPNTRVHAVERDEHGQDGQDGQDGQGGQDDATRPAAAAESPQGETKRATEPPPELSSPTDSPLSPAEIRTLRESVFGLDTFFVQTVDNYGESGVLFKGNIRSGADPSAVQEKLQAKLKAQMPDYSLFLMVDRDDKPTVVVIRDAAAQVGSSASAELLLAVVLGLATVVTTANVFDAQIFNAALLVANIDSEKISASVPGTLAFLGAMGAHELGHGLAARRHNVELSPPIFLPAGLGLLGSFGSITRIKSIVPNRRTLSEVIAPGPTAGLSVGLALTMVGLALTKAQAGGSIELDSASFQESFLVGGLASAVLGQEVFTVESVACHPLFIAGWSALIVNSINLIPAGELDGGKLSLATFGRPAAQFVSVMSFIALGVGSFVNGLALFWLLLALTIQRGPGIPCAEEVSKLEGKDVVRNVLLLLVPALVLLPFPGMPTPLDQMDFSPF